MMNFSVADIALFAYTSLNGDAKLNNFQYPNICKWIDACKTSLQLD